MRPAIRPHRSIPGLARAAARTALVLLVLFAPPLVSRAPAAEIEPGRIYAGGSRLEASELGVAFTVPKGWRGLLPAGSEVFVLQPEADPSVTILALGEKGSREELRRVMAAPVDLGDGVVLQPTAKVGERGPALTGRYRVTGAASPLNAYAEALAGSGGTTVAYVLIASPGSVGSYEKAVRELIASTDLRAAPVEGAAAPAAPGSGASAGAKDRWDTYLEGKYIVRYHTTSGFTDEEHLWLCSDGTFRRRGASGGFGGGASGAFQSDGSGRWTAAGAGERGTLTLSYGDGSTATYQLRWDYAESHLYVDGKRWLHGKNEVCR